MAELKSDVLVLGDGLLGSEIVRQTNWNYISRRKDGFRITDPNSWNFTGYTTIINCIAHTDTYSKGRELHWAVNYQFVHDLIKHCNQHSIKLVHISTEYLYAGSVDNATENDVPVHCNNWYGYTKLLGDGLVQLMSSDYLICRCMHKLNPFPYDSAWIDQIGNFDYVDVISQKIIDLVNRDIKGVYNVGTELKSIFELASRTKRVKPVLSPGEAPKNITMSVNKMDQALSDRPFFSIAIPTYEYGGKGVEFLTHSFNKILSQTFTDFEVVISDHSLNEDIKNLCNEWSSKFKISYIKNDRGRGIISPNINVAMQNCKGRYIKIIFQDDYLYDEKSLEKTKDIIDQNGDAKWVVSSQYHSDDGVNLRNPYTPRWSDNIWAGNNTMGCPTVVTVKNEDLIYFDEGLNWLMDCDFYKKMYDKHGIPCFLYDFTVVNRTWGQRLTDTINDVTIQNETIEMIKRYA